MEEDVEIERAEERERGREGRGLDSSCSVNNIPHGRDRLAHPRDPAAIYLLFILHFRLSLLAGVERERERVDEREIGREREEKRRADRPRGGRSKVFTVSSYPCLRDDPRERVKRLRLRQICIFPFSYVSLATPFFRDQVRFPACYC